MGAITSAVVAMVVVILGWITIEIACKPCLEQGREAIDRALDPNYDPDSSLVSQNRPTAATEEPLLGPAPSATPASSIK
ncbi:outer envelope membrane protein 7 [Musa acuminata AAA Group]|uniref:outer envelope membrane protein 7 n=1 Tax=Musa acuminata AAA Group TaxID=214697 RepID=UPI0031E2DF80